MRDPNSRHTILICVALGLITLALYKPVAGFDFINYDDPEYVVNNGPVKSGLTVPAIAWAFSTGYEGHWHPLTWLSYMADTQFLGTKPGGYHLTSLLLHTANAVLLFLVLARMTGACWRSAFVAALFAWHPLHVEPVAWISSRKDVLSTFFWLLTMDAYLRYVTKPDARRFILTLVLFALGLMSKAMLVTLPCVLLLLDFWPLRRLANAGIIDDDPASGGTALPPLDWLQLVVEKLPFFGLTVLSSIAAYRAETDSGLVAATDTLPFGARLANSLVSYLRYLEKTFWPTHLAIPYPFPEGWAWWKVGGSVLVLLLVSGLALDGRKRRPWLFVGWFWFVGTLVPVIGIVLTGMLAMADRYCYVPSIGLFIVVAWGAPDLLKSLPSRNILLASAGAAALAACVVLSSLQIQYWRNSVTLFTHTTEVTPNNIRAQYDLAQGLETQGKIDEAIAQYQKTFTLRPNPLEAHYNYQAQAHGNLGTIFARAGRMEDAKVQLLKSVQDQPGFVMGHVNLAGALWNLGKLDEAVAQDKIALQLDPGNELALRNLTVTLTEQGKFSEAVTNFNRLMPRFPNDPELHKWYGYALAGMGNIDEAIIQFRQAAQLKPDYAEAYLFWGDALASGKRTAGAGALYEIALKIQPGLPAALRQTADAMKAQNRTNAAALFDRLAKELSGAGPSPRN